MATNDAVPFTDSIVKSTWWGVIAFDSVVVLIGVLSHVYDSGGRAWTEYTWWQLTFFLPVPVLMMVALVGASFNKLAKHIGNDMVEKLDESVCMKDLLKANWTNTGLVCALILSCVAGLVSEPPEPESSILSQWYVVLMWASAGSSINGLLGTVISLTYLEPLAEAGAAAFSKDFRHYLGRPVMMMILSGVMVSGALNLCIFSKNGPWCGLLSAFLWPFAFREGFKQMHHMSTWQRSSKNGQSDVAPQVDLESPFVVVDVLQKSGGTEETYPLMALIRQQAEVHAHHVAEMDQVKILIKQQAELLTLLTKATDKKQQCTPDA